MLTKIRISLLLGVICLSAFNANAAIVQIPSKNVKVREKITLPVQLRNIPRETYGINFYIEYDPSILLSPQMKCYCDTGKIFTSNIISPGKLAIGLASSGPLPRNSSLGILILDIADTNLSSTELRISEVLINEYNDISCYRSKLFIIKPPIINYLKKDAKYFFWEGQGSSNSFWERILRYRYRIDNKKWQYTWAKKALIQSVSKGLSNGVHIFEVQVINLKGITSELKALSFEITPSQLSYSRTSRVRNFLSWWRRYF